MPLSWLRLPPPPASDFPSLSPPNQQSNHPAEIIITHKYKPIVLDFDDDNNENFFRTSSSNYGDEVVVDDRLHKVDDKFCRTQECVISASKMERLIDWKANPCDDFYNFACGRFVKDSTLHDRRDTLNAFSVTDDKLKDQLRRLFTRKIELDEIKPYKMVKMLYKSCINSCASETRGIEPLRKLIDSIGGWPMLETGQWNENGWDLEQSIMKLRTFVTHNKDNIFRGFNFFGRFRHSSEASNVDSDGKRSEGKSAQRFMRAYRSYLIDIAILVGASRPSVETQIDDAIEFQRELIKLNFRREVGDIINTDAINRFRDEVYVKYSLTQWLDLFQAVPAQFFADENKQPALGASDFFSAFDELLLKTSKRTLANYFVLRIIGFSSQHMTREMKARALHYRMELFGVKQKEESWKLCVDVVSTTLDLAVEVMFSQEYFDLESKETAIDIATRIKSTYEKVLLSVSWLSFEDRAKILLKINKIIAQLRFPKELLSQREIDIAYRKVSIEKLEKYFESVLELTIFNADRKFLLLQSGINLNADDAGSVGVLNSVDVKDFNKICMAHRQSQLQNNRDSFFINVFQCFLRAFCNEKFYRPTARNI